MFLTILDYHEHEKNEKIKIIDTPLIYHSPLIDRTIVVPKDFNTDLASVPRVPLIYTLWGDRAHREAVIHDYLYRKDSMPVVPESIANRIFYEAMLSLDKPWWIKHPMYWAVCIAGTSSYHKRKVNWQYR